nr:hypothetical protein CFP56_02580 [Quercus suber]
MIFSASDQMVNSGVWSDCHLAFTMVGLKLDVAFLLPEDLLSATTQPTRLAMTRQPVAHDGALVSRPSIFALVYPSALDMSRGTAAVVTEADVLCLLLSHCARLDTIRFFQRYVRTSLLSAISNMKSTDLCSIFCALHPDVKDAPSDEWSHRRSCKDSMPMRNRLLITTMFALFQSSNEKPHNHTVAGIPYRLFGMVLYVLGALHIGDANISIATLPLALFLAALPHWYTIYLAESNKVQGGWSNENPRAFVARLNAKAASGKKLSGLEEKILRGQAAQQNGFEWWGVWAVAVVSPPTLRYWSLDGVSC